MKSDRQLGMHRSITRRDLLHGAGTVAAGMSLPSLALGQGGAAATAPAVYPPTRTGLRGSHPGSFEAAHTYARDGVSTPPARDTGEAYDLVVVGAGISGLAAAQFYRDSFGPEARILLLENHDDFGGHAKRNEFHQSGQMRLALGGTHNLEYWQFSDDVQRYMQRLGIDHERMLRTQEFGYGQNGARGPAIWFDEATYGENRLVTGLRLENPDTEAKIARIDSFPVSSEAREQLKRFYRSRRNILAGRSQADIDRYLTGTRYVDFLRDAGGLGPEAIQLFDNANHGGWGLETRVLSVAEALGEGLPGLQLMGEDRAAEPWDYPAALFPDGNASVARLQVQALIPAVAPGTTAENVAVAQFDYSRLDRDDWPVRLRLNATVLRVQNRDGGVDVSYLRDGAMERVRARHCVLACYHVVIPHLCPEMPRKQREAQKYQIKKSLLLTNVLIRSSAAMDRLGIAGAYCPGRLHSDVWMFKGLNTAGYQHRFDDDGPVPLTFWGSVAPPADIEDFREQLRASRRRMLALTFEDYEREVRTVMDGMLGPAGFDVRRDVLAITVNRWPHGYSHDYLDLWDPEWPPGEAPHEIARRPFGNIAIANADAGADAYTHVAIDQAHRAVGELN